MPKFIATIKKTDTVTLEMNASCIEYAQEKIQMILDNGFDPENNFASSIITSKVDFGEYELQSIDEQSDN